VVVVAKGKVVTFTARKLSAGALGINVTLKPKNTEFFQEIYLIPLLSVI